MCMGCAWLLPWMGRAWLLLWADCMAQWLGHAWLLPWLGQSSFSGGFYLCLPTSPTLPPKAPLRTITAGRQGSLCVCSWLCIDWGFVVCGLGASLIPLWRATEPRRETFGEWFPFCRRELGCRTLGSWCHPTACPLKRGIHEHRQTCPGSRW